MQIHAPVTLQLPVARVMMKRGWFSWGNRMRFRTLVATCAAVSVSLSALATAASAHGVVFDSLDGLTSSAAFAGGIILRTLGDFQHQSCSRSRGCRRCSEIVFRTSARRATLIQSALTARDSSFRSLLRPDWGIGLCQRVLRRLSGAGDQSRTFPLTSLPTAWTLKQYDQFASVALNPNSLYWIEVSVHSASDEFIIEWGTTANMSGPGVAGNYSAWSLTDDGFFVIKALTRSHLTAPFRWRSTPSPSPRPGP